MTRLVKCTMTIAAALVAFAQVVVAPASCCLIRAELFGNEACCHSAPAAEPVTRSCCHGRTTGAEDGIAEHRVPAVPEGECLWCSASPKVATNDRVVVADDFAAPAVATASLAAPVETPSSGFKPLLDEPFHRTAIAACAWLCTWQI